MSVQREVPEHEVIEFAPRKHKYCVAVFVLNENGRLQKQLERMRMLTDQIDIVIADGGSSDGCTEHGLLQDFRVNTLLIKRGPGKLGSQMRMAFAWAMDRGYEGVVVVDGNNKDSVENVPDFISKLEEGYDHVQGSRYLPGGHHENTPLIRHLGVRLLHAPLLKLASGFRYTDTTNGFRAYSRKLLNDERIDLFRDVFSGYELHYYLACYAPYYKMKCIEIPVSRRYPKTGKTPTKIKGIKGNLTVLRSLFAVCIGRYKTKRPESHATDRHACR